MIIPPSSHLKCWVILGWFAPLVITILKHLLTDDDSWMFVLFCTIIVKYWIFCCDLMVLALWQGPQIFRSRRHSTCESPFCGSQVGGCEWRSLLKPIEMMTYGKPNMVMNLGVSWGQNGDITSNDWFNHQKRCTCNATRSILFSESIGNEKHDHKKKRFRHVHLWVPCLLRNIHALGAD